MSGNQCPDCGRQLPKNHNRCLYCDDLKYKSELESTTSGDTTPEVLSNRLTDLAEFAKNQKEARKQAKLDEALAWGKAIGEKELNIDSAHESRPDSYCSACGFKFAASGSFCPGCGVMRNGITPSSSALRSSVAKRRKKSGSSVWAILFMLLAVLGIGYGIFVNFSNKIFSDNVPQDFETSSESNYDGMAEACDHVRIAISHHDPRYLSSRDSQSDIDIYKSEMQLAANIFRDESNYNPNAYELTRIAQQMHDGYRGIDEYGRFPLMEFCGV